LVFSITVKNNAKYRFRAINTGGVSQCPIEIKIQEHYLTVITIDGHPIEFKSVDVVQVEPGLIFKQIYVYIHIIYNTPIFYYKY